METVTSLETEIDMKSLLEDEIPCEPEHGSGESHAAVWYADFGCENCGQHRMYAICDRARKLYEDSFDEQSHCACGVDDVTFGYFFHGFTPIKG